MEIPWSDTEFVARALWKKLPVAGQKLSLQGNRGLCPLDGLLETHDHRFRSCAFMTFVFDFVRKTFGCLRGPQGEWMEISRLITDFPLYSIATTQGLLVWAAVQVIWAIRWDVQYGRGGATLDEFVVKWRGKLATWLAYPNMSLSRLDLRLFSGSLLVWLEEHRVPCMDAQPHPLARPELREAARRERKRARAEGLAGMEQEIARRSAEGRDIAYTDGSSVVEGSGLRLGGFGVWYAADDPRNISMPLNGPVQTNNRAELQAAVAAVRRQPLSKPLHIVTDSELVYKGAMGRAEKWRAAGWMGSKGQVKHQDLWEALLTALHKFTIPVTWQQVPSHIGLAGNEGADKLADAGRLLHPALCVRVDHQQGQRRAQPQGLPQPARPLLLPNTGSKGQVEVQDLSGMARPGGESQDPPGAGQNQAAQPAISGDPRPHPPTPPRPRLCAATLEEIGLEILTSGSSGRGSSIDSGRTSSPPSDRDRPLDPGVGVDSREQDWPQDADSPGEEVSTDSEGRSSSESESTAYSTDVSDSEWRGRKRARGGRERRQQTIYSGDRTLRPDT